MTQSDCSHDIPHFKVQLFIVDGFLTTLYAVASEYPFPSLAKREKKETAFTSSLEINSKYH